MNKRKILREKIEINIYKMEITSMDIFIEILRDTFFMSILI